MSDLNRRSAYAIIALVIVTARFAVAAHAQDDPCPSQEAALIAASSGATPVNQTYAQTMEQFAALFGPVAAEAPELIGAQTDVLNQLITLQGSGIGDTDAADAAAAAALIDTDLALLQSGSVGPDGSARPNVIQASNLALQAKDQAQAVATANQNVVDATQALEACAEAAAGAGDNGGGN